VALISLLIAKINAKHISNIKKRKRNKVTEHRN